MNTDTEERSANMEAFLEATREMFMSKLEAWRVYRVNETDWYIARSADEARKTCMEDYDVTDPDDCIEEPVREVTEEEMDRMKIRFEDAPPGRDVFSFREEFNRRLTQGVTAPVSFLCTE